MANHDALVWGLSVGLVMSALVGCGPRGHARLPMSASTFAEKAEASGCKTRPEAEGKHVYAYTIKCGDETYTAWPITSSVDCAGSGDAECQKRVDKIAR
jgi:hypothetical protein